MDDYDRKESGNNDSFAPHCLSIDLEVGKETERIHKFAAVRGDNGQAFKFSSGNLLAELAKLDDFAEGCSFLLGHNLIAFDAHYLAAAKPDLRLLKLPMVDTLRLNPLAFPRNPYHHLVKHYQDGQLKHGQRNDPELDARLTLDVFRDQHRAFQGLQRSNPDLLLIWHWLTTLSDQATVGLNAFFMTLRHRMKPSEAEARTAIERFLHERGCATHGHTILAEAKQKGWALAYALTWLSVAGGNSVMPPWVRHQFPEAGILVRRLRDTACHKPDCAWCQTRHNALKELRRWFSTIGHFRPEPTGPDGQPLQQLIVEAALRGEPLLGILPTGTGKSLCYQIPALSRYDKTGALTVVISPLVALMVDQVAGLEAHGITCCATLNGLLPLPERADVLDRVRLGDVGILIISPEQLRNLSVRKALAQREIGIWVLDEAHCLSKWGHDFRPDYRYVGRFIKEKADQDAPPPILCLTATAKPEVTADIVSYFRDKLAINLKVFDGGASRINLDFIVATTTTAEKFSHIQHLLATDLPPDQPGGAIIYCATRKHAQEVAQFLNDKALETRYFHSMLSPETKKTVQKDFVSGGLRIIAATSAFGMGIDKKDVRLVVHADIPNSLENYLQEAGRAGRDRQPARCVLLYTPEDVERQFGMSARSRLTQREIQAILKALRNLNRKKRLGGEVVVTAGEILAEDEDETVGRDSATDDTRVRVALAWLEEAGLLSREENRTQVFPSSLRVNSLEDAQRQLDKYAVVGEYRHQLETLVAALIAADADQGISTDELMGLSGLSASKLGVALHKLEHLGIASNDTVLTAFVHAAVERSSKKRFEDAEALEKALLDELREAAPDLGKGEVTVLHLRHTTQHLKEIGLTDVLPEKLWRLVKSLARDGRAEGGVGSLHVRRLDAETAQITLQRDWSALTKTAELRRTAAHRLLHHLLDSLPSGMRGTDLLAETTLGKLMGALEGEVLLKAEMKDPPKLLERALLWLHEQDVIRLNKGLTIFRPAMTIRLSQEKRNFLKSDFLTLKQHYDEQIVQIHVMVEYVQRGLMAMTEALRLTVDYFRLQRAEFLSRWLPEREKELTRQTTPQSWRAIVEALNNPVQQRIVTDDREQANILILAGPGSGKTRVLVHRIAYLVRVRRENPRGILALAYNRHAAVEIRRRLAELINDNAKGVIVLTCHALAMRLAGVSFVGRAHFMGDEAFKAVLRQAVALLKGEGLPPEEADEQRERLLAGFRWILVDEYQDIGPEQYELISALAGRARSDEDSRLSLFAVGDDDQNIYAFDGASVEFIRRFEADYAAKPVYLTENYRSTAHIIAAANCVIDPARSRMKAAHPIIIDRSRAKTPPGGDWQLLDPISQARVQILPAGDNDQTQAVAVITELQRLSKIAPAWDWSRTAIIARYWNALHPVRAYCEHQGIPVQMADDEAPHFWRLRETQILLEWLYSRDNQELKADTLHRWLDSQPSCGWWLVVRQAVDEYALENGNAELPYRHFTEWLAEWGREIRRRQTGVLLLTAHRAKGLEFDQVAVLDGGWDHPGRNEDRDAPRRLYYVAMTRAKKLLILAHRNGINPLLDSLPEGPPLLRRQPTPPPPPPPILAHFYTRPTLKDIDIGFAGRHDPNHPIHRKIASLSTGDTLDYRLSGDRWLLTTGKGDIVGRLAQSFKPPHKMLCIEARVAAILTRWKKDDESNYRDFIRCERWEVVLPELVFAPKP